MRRFRCLYTKHKTQKRKRWHDGILSVNNNCLSLHSCEDGLFGMIAQVPMLIIHGKSFVANTTHFSADTATVIGNVLEVKRSPNGESIGTDQMIDFEGFLVETTEIMKCSGEAPAVAPDRTSYLSRQNSTFKRRSTLTTPRTQELTLFAQSSEHDMRKRHRKLRNRTDKEILALFLPPAQSTPQYGMCRIPQSCLSDCISVRGVIQKPPRNFIPKIDEVDIRTSSPSGHQAKYTAPNNGDNEVDTIDLTSGFRSSIGDIDSGPKRSKILKTVSLKSVFGDNSIDSRATKGQARNLLGTLSKKSKFKAPRAILQATSANKNNEQGRHLRYVQPDKTKAEAGALRFVGYNFILPFFIECSRVCN